MSQEELRAFFNWCEENLKQFYSEACEESEHYYLGDIRLGGWAGDRQEYFFEHTNKLASALRMWRCDNDG